MEQQELLAVAGDFAIAILLGALVGIEREKRKAEEQETEHIAGLRTFTLLALLGAASGFLARSLSSPWILAAALVVVGAFVVVGYLTTARVSQDGKGLTTEVAALVVFLLGALVMFGERELAIGLGVVTAAVLAYKQPLHGFVEKLGWDDVYAGLRLLIATFIALPLLPDRAIDPWGALNPYSLWLLVILISSLSLVGYVLTTMARTCHGDGADRIDGRPRFLDRGHLVLCARGPRQPAKHGSARLRHPARLVRHVPARHRPGGGGEPRAPCPGARPVSGHGLSGRGLRGLSLFSRRLGRRQPP